MRWAASSLAGLFLAWCIVLGFAIVAEGSRTSPRRADAAVVLGAAVNGDAPSPVFEARIRHGIALFKAGTVRRLVFTGGAAGPDVEAEALVARRYAMRRGVPAEAILLETVSRTTRQNLGEARPLLQREGIRTVLVVSDPLHMKRALRMASDLGIDAEGSPTLTSRYRSWGAKAPFLLREIFFYNFYLITGR